MATARTRLHRCGQLERSRELREAHSHHAWCCRIFVGLRGLGAKVAPFVAFAGIGGIDRQVARMTSPWQAFLTEQDLAVVARGRFGRRMGFGERAAVLVIDAQRYMVGEAGDDASWPSSCGEAGRRAVFAIAQVVSAAQAARVPCFFTRFELARDGTDMGVYRRKRDLLDSDHWCLAGTPGSQLVPELEPAEGDVEFVKKKPSGFHGTPLLGFLIERRIDTVIVTGGATSNCIRATVFDAASYNFRVIVPQEAVFDRIPISHAISLFDMDRQFADVIPMAQVLDYLQRTTRGAPQEPCDAQ